MEDMVIKPDCQAEKKKDRTQKNRLTRIFGTTSAKESAARSSRNDTSRTGMDDSNLVPKIVTTLDQVADNFSSGENNTDSTILHRGIAQPLPTTEINGMSLVRQKLQDQQISQRAQDIISESWRKSTKTQYAIYIQKWKEFCGRRHCNPLLTTVSFVLDFLVELHDSGLGYSAINTARSALSTVVTLSDGVPAGTHPLVCRFMKGIFHVRPVFPRYQQIWDVSIVLRYIKTLTPMSELPLKLLTYKLVMLMALLTGQRCQSLYIVTTNNISFQEEKVVIVLTESVKQSAPGKPQPVLVLPKYSKDDDLCVVKTLQHYLQRTDGLRSIDYLFVTTMKPYSRASKPTISGWIKNVLTLSGVDTSVFRPHSTRSASTSLAAKSLPLEQVMKTAGWSQSCTFAKYYNKPIFVDSDITYANAILSLAT